MGTLLYLDDHGKTFEITKESLTQMISDARAKASLKLATSGDAEAALTVFQDEMKNMNVLIRIYRGQFAPYPK